MNDAKFDRLARTLATTVSRRWLVALAGAATGVFGQQAASGSQLGPATCGEQGAVCTLMAGCCDGLTCATSAINTSYGICVPGDGGMVSTGTTLISPFSETAVEEVVALVQTVPTTTTTDPQAEREARIAEIRARKDANRSQRKTRLDTKRTKVQTRKDEHRTRQLEAREEAEEALGPQLQLGLILANEDDTKTPEDTEVPVDTVKVTNLDDVNVVITRIESILAPKDGISLTTAPSKFTLSQGESYFLVSGLTTADATDTRFDWSTAIACDGSPGAGYLVKAAFSISAENHDFLILCDGPQTVSFVDAPAETSRRKRNRNNQHKKKKKR